MKIIRILLPLILIGVLAIYAIHRAKKCRMQTIGVKRREPRIIWPRVWPSA